MSPADLALDPAIVRWVARVGELGAELADLALPPSPARRRAALRLSDTLAEEFTLPVPDGVAVTDGQLAGQAGQLRARWFRPVALSGPAPTQLFLHGGGFHGGTIEETLNDRVCAARARDAGIQIVSLEYRLAPEHPFPAAVEDAIAALHTLAGSHEVDDTRLGIGGNSAGAMIAASAAILLRDGAADLLLHQDLEVLPGSLSPVGESAQQYARGFGLDDADALADLYLGAHTRPYAASPLDVEDLAGLPPALVMVAEHDLLRDSGLAYADRLREAGVQVTAVVGVGHLHGTPGLTAALPIARDWQSTHAAALATAYRTDPTPLTRS